MDTRIWIRRGRRTGLRRALFSCAAVLLKLMIFVGVALAVNTVIIDGNVSDWTDELCRPDKVQSSSSGTQTSGGFWYDDQTSQNDVSKFCAASNHDPSQQDPNDNGDTLFVMWQWDDMDFSGNNSGDGCALFDTNQDGNIDKALCNTISTSGGSTSVVTTLYTCNNSTPDRCSGKSTATFSGICQLDTNAADPFSSEAGHTDCNGTNCTSTDVAVECSIPLSDISLSAGASVLAGMCTYPSGQPNSNAKDCTLDPTVSRLGVNTDTGNNSETTPTAITLLSLSGKPADTSPALPALVILVSILGLLVAGGGGLWVRRRRHR